MVAGAVVQAYGTHVAAKGKKAEARLRQAQLEEQKKDAVVTTMQEHNMRMANLNAAIGINTSLAGVMGRDSGSDRSLAKVQKKFKEEARTEDSRARLQFLREQSQRSLGVQLAQLQGKNAMRAGRIQMASSLLTAGHHYSKIS